MNQYTTPREFTEQNEEKFLSPLAVKSREADLRGRAEEKCSIRTCFQRDRDRIIHCKSFRRLKHKTQVFLSPEGDHYRTRLTHTLEVSQIARTIARALRLNEDLTEAIALGHDLGHTPFGHAGERALREVCPLGFEHDLHSVRVAEALEKKGRGLNLTRYVLDGFANHTWNGMASTLEGQIVRYADVIAYINHDIDDAVRGGVISRYHLPQDVMKVLGTTHSERISNMINGVLSRSRLLMEEFLASGESYGGQSLIDMEPELKDATLALKDFMFANVYFDSEAKKEESKAVEIVKALYLYFAENTEMLDEEYTLIMMNSSPERAAADYVASMTDHYAVRLYTDIYIPKSWST